LSVLAQPPRPPGSPPANLTQARELFTSMGYKPALAETDTLLELTPAPAP
jgi:hypothetical protein